MIQRASAKQFVHSAMLLVATVVNIGCRHQELPATEGTAGRQLAVLARLYTEFRLNNHNRSPRSEQELQDYIHALDPNRLKKLGISHVGDLFVSNRDGEPLVVVYDEQGRRSSSVVAYEQNGTDGMRFGAYAQGVVREVDEAEFRDFVQPAVNSNSPNRL